MARNWVYALSSPERLVAAQSGFCASACPGTAFMPRRNPLKLARYFFRNCPVSGHRHVSWPRNPDLRHKANAMSKQTIYSIIGFFIVVGLLIAIKPLPRKWAEQERDKIIKIQVDEAAHDAIQKVATDAIRDTARMFALSMAPDTSKSDVVTSVTPPSSPSTHLDRPAYSITLPDTSTIDAQDKDLDLNHFTTANLPNKGTLILVVIDDKSRGASAFEKTVANLKAKLQNPTPKTPSCVDTAKSARSAAFDGTIKDEAFSF